MTFYPLANLLAAAAKCERLGHEWKRTGPRNFVCLWCPEVGFDASPERLAELERRWTR